MRLIGFAGLLLLASPAVAAERGYSITSFDRIRVEGPFVVTVTTGKAVSGRASGSAEALERVSVSVEGRTLTIRPNSAGWGGYPGRQVAPAAIAITTPGLSTVILVGSGRLEVDRMKGLRVIVTVEGSGRVGIRALDADNASLAVAGSGTIEAAGSAHQVAAVVRGTAEIRAPRLVVSDLILTSESAGAVTMQASRSAKVSALGTGSITVAGTASCQVKKVGSGPLTCGKL